MYTKTFVRALQCCDIQRTLWPKTVTGCSVDKEMSVFWQCSNGQIRDIKYWEHLLPDRMFSGASPPRLHVLGCWILFYYISTISLFDMKTSWQSVLRETLAIPILLAIQRAVFLKIGTKIYTKLGVPHQHCQEPVHISKSRLIQILRRTQKRYQYAQSYEYHHNVAKSRATPPVLGHTSSVGLFTGLCPHLPHQVK